ncbi:heterokaryon incompatibility protein-domain-containing protein [Dactylonectria estremocensis]|uniref:Heterokaryon incompatibility protein-domain-containing protein n=1 Tax=Dactylonectria estremocensis TaxID=1079267 RepID=A0A9P9JHQ8_9HYPO|nr:heterokaryon incompatibility protein-domain-containing protein [Dactylonectria estremocensis]
MIEAQYKFRLLRLLPAKNFHDRIRCRLTCSSPFADPYEALSYTWGDSDKTISIEIDGHPVAIRENLAAALRQLRTFETARTLWVDALCINQTDSEEKGWQVPRMHEIYFNADKVVVWLGDASELSDLAFDLIRNAAAVKCKEEVAFSKAYIALCGPRHLDWRDFTDSFNLVAQTLILNIGRGTSKSFLRMRFIAQMNTFHTLVRDFSARSIGIFPVLSLEYEPGLRGLWKADYNKSAAQIFANVTFFVYLRFKDLRFLNLVEALMEEKDDSSVFTGITGPTLLDFAHLRLIHDESKKQTSFRLRTSPKQRIETDDASFLELFFGIKTQGRHLGTVSVVGDDFYGRDLILVVVEAFRIVASMEEYVRPPGQSPYEALLRTLSGDRNADGTPFQSQVSDSFSITAPHFMRGKGFIVIGGGIGLCPRATRAGDDIYIIPGCHVPIVLRKKMLYTANLVCLRHIDTGDCVQLSCTTKTEGRVLNGQATDIIEEYLERFEELHLR